MTDLYNRDATFWKKYMQHRPFPPQWVWDRIWSYHAEHSSNFDTAHDGGAGPGVHSPMLGKKFSKVIVSDPAASNVEEAKKYLSNESDKTNYEFHIAKFEELLIKPDASVDLVLLANSFHFTDQSAAHLCAASQLKPGGTYAIGLWWDACFLPKYPRIEELYRHTIDQAREQLAPDPVGSKKWHDWQATMKILYTSNASIVLPDEFLPESIARIEINREPAVTIYFDEVSKKDFGFKSSESYRAEHIKDEKWSFQTDFSGLMERFVTYRWDSNTPEMQKLMAQLESEFEKEGGTVDGLWQATLLLATRR